MKKVSTAATKQSRNFSGQKLTIRVDLGDCPSYDCVLDKRGELVLKQKISTTAKALREVFGGMPRSPSHQLAPFVHQNPGQPLKSQR